MDAQQTDELSAITKKMEELSRKMQACGGDVSCLQGIMEEMEKLTKEYQKTQVPGGQPAGGPSPQKLQATKKEVAQALQAFKDDPCYPVYFDKELIKRIEGFDMSWVKCVPLKISLTWDIDERYTLQHGPRYENRARYTLEESYPGYLRIEYDQKEGNKINGFYIGGSSPQRLGRVKASLSKVSATFHVYTAPSVLEGVVSTNDPSDFTVHKGTDLPDAHIAISNNVAWGSRSVNIQSSNIIPSKKLVKYPVAGILETLEGGTLNVSVGDLSVEDMQRGLREGKLVKEFPIHKVMDHAALREVFQRDGTVTVHIDFTPVRERWQVMVNTVNILGYGSHNRNFGIQVHAEREVEIVIENGEFKSAKGKTSFVSIRPYSKPAGLFQCEPEAIEVVGTGTDTEMERYDQVRHAERFNPPKTPQDKALKQEWLKIKKSKTPYAFPKTYSVKGTKSGSQVDLFFPKSSGYVVAHRCDPGDDFIREWQQKWRKKWKFHERWSHRDYDRFLFPETVKILLENNWYTDYHYTTKFYGPNVGWKECPKGTPEGQAENTDQIRVKRIE